MNDNNKLIFELIKNNFGYIEENLNYIESQLENNTSLDFIEKLFANSNDERIYFPISIEYKEKIDMGWSTFKKMFMDFVSFYEMSYANFIENKIIVNKNSLKLKKALVSFYIKKRAKLSTVGSINLKANQSILMENSLSGYKEIIFSKPSGEISLLTFTEMDSGFSFINTASIAIMNGTKSCKNINPFEAILSLTKDILVKISSCNRIAFIRNKEDDFISFYVNKISEGGLNFFRRQKLSLEVTQKYFNNKVFLTTTNDDRTIKMFYIDQNNYLSSTLFSINQENGELLFKEEITSDICICDKINSFSVINKEKHSEFYFSIINSKTKETNVIKFITENGVNFIATAQEFEGYISINDTYNMFSNNLIYSIRNGLINIYVNNMNKTDVSEEIKKFIEDDISKKLDNVGALSLPKNKDISVVISKNFADWFLCSTAETWTSCLNLESKHSTCYWQGLPALLGDKNRVMFYITDGTKKIYKGIVVDKLLSRTWGLLDNNNNFNIIKFYPFDILDEKDLSNIINIPINFIDRNFISKYPINLIFYKYNDRFYCSSFIFQDKTQFGKMIDGYHLIFGASNGFYSIVKDTKKNIESIKPINIFEYTGGLSYLKDRKENLTLYRKNVSLSDERCIHCGYRILEDSKYHLADYDKIYCDNCFHDKFFYCDICNNVFEKLSNYYKTIHSEDYGKVLVCTGCCYDNVITCDICGKYIFKTGSTKYFNEHNEIKNLCLLCIGHQNANEFCDQCGSYFHENVIEKNHVIHDHIGNTYCGKCLFEISDKKQTKFSFFIEV